MPLAMFFFMMYEILFADAGCAKIIPPKGLYLPWHVRDENGKRGLFCPNVSAALKTSRFSEQSFIREL